MPTLTPAEITCNKDASAPVLGETLPPRSPYWHTMGNLPGAGLFARFQQGEFCWTNGETIARDVKMLWWLAAGHSLTEL